MARQNQAISNGEAQRRHHLSTYTDDEKRWLVEVDEEERMRGKGFMERLKMRWDQQFPEKNIVFKQTLRDNAIRFRREMENRGRKKTKKDKEDNDGRSSNGNIEWTTEMKVYLLEIEKKEQGSRRGSRLDPLVSGSQSPSSQKYMCA